MIQHNNYKNINLRQILETFSHYQQVSFAFYCAKEVETFTNDQRVLDCNLVVQRWLNGDKSVDLELARNNAWNAWDTSSNAAAAAAAAAYYAAADASAAAYYAAADASAAAAAYYAVAAAYYASASAYYASASASAYYAASAKSYNLFPNNATKRYIAFNQFYKEYNQIAQNWLSQWTIPNFPKEESDFPIFDFLIDMNLISYLLPKKDNFYYLNLNGFPIKHVNEAELLKIINTIHIKNILRRIINNDSAQQL